MAAAKDKQNIAVRSEDELGKKWDQCLTDASIKTASGLGLGIVFSVLFFRRRKWPAILGTGIGFGKGYADCDNSFQNRDVIYSKIRKIGPAETAKS